MGIVIPAPVWSKVRAHLLPGDSDNEQLAYLLAGDNRTADRSRLLVHEAILAGPDDLLRQTPTSIAPKPEFVARVLERCRKEGWHLVEAHSHPFAHGMGTTFSPIDWTNDRAKMPAVAKLLDQDLHATMVLGHDSLDAHLYDHASGHIQPIERVVIVGVDHQNAPTGMRILVPTSAPCERPASFGHPSGDKVYHRQELIFGVEGQRRLQTATVCVVGLGGLGSFVALELAVLGVGRLILVDDDVVQVTNLNRLVGVERKNGVGRNKAEVYADIIRPMAPQVRVEALPLSILDEVAIAQAKSADVLVGAVDRPGPRMILNQLSARYLIPYIDGGTGINQRTAHTPMAAGGQVQVVLPGAGCLECRGFLDMQRVAFDLGSIEQQAEERSHGYGLDEPAPAVVFLNGVIGSLQVAEVVFLLTGSDFPLAKAVPPIALYNALDRSLVPLASSPSPDCLTCGAEGVLGVGDLAPIRRATSPAHSDSLPWTQRGATAVLTADQQDQRDDQDLAAS